MPTVHAVYKPIKIICYCLQAGQAQRVERQKWQNVADAAIITSK